MNLYECQRHAENIGYDSATFKCRFPAGVFNCKWLDAYMGLFTVDADGMRDGFLMVDSISRQFPDAECFDLSV